MLEVDKYLQKLAVSLFLLATYLICQPNANAQNPEWMNFCGDEWVNAMAEEGDFLWIAASV